jgi:hypothetical protein
MFHNANDAAAFVRAGNATITISSRKTGARYTYRVRAPSDVEPEANSRRFVALLTGPQNESDYTYLGMLRDDKFALTRASKLTADSVPVKAFDFFARHVLHGIMPADLEIRHEGRCGRCGRKLTVPESIDRGIGPECIKHVGG